VISTYGPGLGLERDTALRVAGAFGAGMARMGRACGAVTGALMVIGLQHGKRQAEDDETRDRCYELVKEFVVQFQARHGSITCKELLGYDLSIPEQRERAGQEGLFETLCPKLVRDAAEIVESLIVSREGAEARIGERRSGPASQMTNVGR
jgi:C_GCAxxG_C_C family probable redox protein